MVYALEAALMIQAFIVDAFESGLAQPAVAVLMTCL
jgi:hypothetical protein